jgi:DNA-binding GntR family transcriptional regulator
MEFLEKFPGESAREYVVRLIRANIINLNLKPGQSISEKEIAAELGISRTPVREAFIKLSQEELLDIYPQKGTYVSLINLNIVEEARFLRLTLEKAIVKLACRDITDQHLIDLEENLKLQEFYIRNQKFDKALDLDNQFHRILFKSCRKERIYWLMESINTHFCRLRLLRLTANINLDKMLSEHQSIISTIRENAPEKAEKVMESHLLGLIVEQEILKQQYPDYFK